MTGSDVVRALRDARPYATIALEVRVAIRRLDPLPPYVVVTGNTVHGAHSAAEAAMLAQTGGLSAIIPTERIRP